MRQPFTGEQTVTSAGGDPQTAPTLDPIAGGGACARVNDKDDPGTANYRIPVNDGFTLLGQPTVRAKIATQGTGGQLPRACGTSPPTASRRWSRAAPTGWPTTRPGNVTFQLNGNGYSFERGHVAQARAARPRRAVPAAEQQAVHASRSAT